MKKSSLFLLLLTLSVVGVAMADPSVRINADFPGGNVRVTANNGTTVQVEPDLRGDRPWFYWLFEATAEKPGEVTFVFPEEVAGFKNGGIGFQGPAISRDGGATWTWMGTETVKDNRFTVEFESAGETVRLGVTIPYTRSDLETFLKEHAKNPHLAVTELTRSREDRPVDLIQIGNRDESRHAVLFTARHHACETMASYVLEGILAEAMAGSPEGIAFRERFILFSVPIVDADGVEKGDQGKNRQPHDHNRDYTTEPIYPEIRAIQELHRKEGFTHAFDLHCPTLVMDSHQVMYFVGARIHPPKNFEKISAFAKEIKARLPENAPHGPLVWLKDEIRPTPLNSRWFGFQEGVVTSATLEIPFAPKGRATDVESCRAYGRAILKAFVATPFEEMGPSQGKVTIKEEKATE